MVEVQGHLKLLPSSILDMYKVFEYVEMLYICIECQPYIVIPTLLVLGQILGLWVTCGVKMM
jgi:hypothetical protein